MTDEEYEKISYDKDKAMLSGMKTSKKEFESICDYWEGINCDRCPLNITRESDLGKFEFCLLWGLNDGIKEWKKYMKERHTKST